MSLENAILELAKSIQANAEATALHAKIASEMFSGVAQLTGSVSGSAGVEAPAEKAEAETKAKPKAKAKAKAKVEAETEAAAEVEAPEAQEAPAEKAEVEAPAEKPVASVETKREYTLEDCRKMMMDVSTSTGSQAEAMKLLNDLGYDKIGQLEPAKYGQLIAAGNKLLGRA
jgi:predicted ATPase